MIRLPKTKSFWRFLVGFLLLLMATGVGASSQLQQSPFMSDGSGKLITESAIIAAGGFATASDTASVIPRVRAPAMLARADYQKVYEQANALLDVGTTVPPNQTATATFVQHAGRVSVELSRF